MKLLDPLDEKTVRQVEKWWDELPTYEQYKRKFVLYCKESLEKVR